MTPEVESKPEKEITIQDEYDLISSRLAALMGLQSDRKFLQLSDIEQMLINMHIAALNATLEVVKYRIAIQNRF